MSEPNSGSQEISGRSLLTATSADEFLELLTSAPVPEVRLAYEWLQENLASTSVREIELRTRRRNVTVDYLDMFDVRGKGEENAWNEASQVLGKDVLGLLLLQKGYKDLNEASEQGEMSTIKDKSDQYVKSVSNRIKAIPPDFVDSVLATTTSMMATGTKLLSNLFNGESADDAKLKAD